MFVAIREDNKQPITAKEADKLHRRMIYRCPVCGNEMTIRHRKDRAPYFIHKGVKNHRLNLMIQARHVDKAFVLIARFALPQCLLDQPK